MKKKILVFIPTYNCKSQIIRVIRQFDKSIQNYLTTVLLVDNKSLDNTLQISVKASSKKFKYCRFKALENKKNYGLGGSHKVAFRYAVDNKYDYLIVLHGDDQASIKDIIPLLKNGLYTKYDCLLGSRFMKSSKLIGYSKFRTFGNRVYNLLFSMILGKKVSDLGSGLNLYSLNSFQKFYYKKFPDNLTFNYVMILASYHLNQRVLYFPISWREEDQVSNVKLFKQAFNVLFMLLKFSFNRNKFLLSELREKKINDYFGDIKFDNNQEG